LKHRALVGFALLSSLVMAIFSSRAIRLQFQFRDFYDFPGNAQSQLLRRDVETFGDPAGYVVALIEADDVFRADVLEYVARLTRTLEPESAFVRVRSLSNAQVIRGDGDDVVNGPVFSEVPQTVQALTKKRRLVLESSLLRRRLISSDGKTTAVLAEMRTPSAFASIVDQEAAIAAVRRAVTGTHLPSGVAVRVTGAPVVDVGVTQSLLRDQMILVPGVIAALSLVLFGAFQSLHCVLLCLTAVSVATIGTAGAFALLHRPVDIIGSLVPTTILVYGVVDPIFVLARVLQKLDRGREKDDAIVEAFSELGLPCFLTSLTTALGFAAFVTAPQPTIRYYGLTVAVGVLLSWATSITVLPILLSLVSLPKRRSSSLAFVACLEAALRSLWRFLCARRGWTIAVTCILLVSGSWLAQKQHIDNVYVDELPRGATRNDVRRLEQQLFGILSINVHLEGPPEVMKRPDVLQRIEAVDSLMEKQPLVAVVSSLADPVAAANQAFHGGDIEERKVPDSRGLIAQYLALIDPADRSALVAGDFSQAQIALLLVDPGSERVRQIVHELRDVVRRAGFEALGVRAIVTGKGVLGYEELDGVVSALLRGFVFAFAVIVALQWFVFRSLRLALIGVVPNVLPMIASFLCLRVFGIRLRIDTALVLCISVGGLFNTTIHFAARVQQLVAHGATEPDLIVSNAICAIGPPALFTASALSVGFSVLFLSSFPGLQELGLLTMVTLCVGLASDMIVTAVLLRVGYDWSAAVRRAAHVISADRRVVGPPPAVHK
jgi:predicted RND superfamily exporter protein